MHRLNVWRFAVAAAAMLAALSALCGVAVIISLDATISVFNTWFHGLDLRLLVPAGGKSSVTVDEVFAGAISAGVVGFLGGMILAGCYNLLPFRPVR
jgi:hypothetical protein